MKIDITLWGQLKQKAGQASLEMETADDQSLGDALVAFAETAPPALKALLLNKQGQWNASILVSVNGEHVRELGDARLPSGAQVALMSPIAGG